MMTLLRLRLWGEEHISLGEFGLRLSTINHDGTLPRTQWESNTLLKHEVALYAYHKIV